LAAFAALIADLTARSTVVIAAGFANRNRVETQNIVGPFLNPVHLVIPYDEGKTFLDWLAFVRDRVFEATTRGLLKAVTTRRERSCLQVVGLIRSDRRYAAGTAGIASGRSP
jgi:non-ribosomal peptide synthetase component F